jgi:hypothetical protein
VSELTSKRSSSTVVLTPMTAMPTATRPPPTKTFLPYAKDTKRDCFLYATGLVTELASCGSVAQGFGFTISELLKWNPSLRNKSPCVLDKDLQYCVQSRKLEFKDTTRFCDRASRADWNATCSSFVANTYINGAGFRAWNPSVGSQCENFKSGKHPKTNCC